MLYLKCGCDLLKCACDLLNASIQPTKTSGMAFHSQPINHRGFQGVGSSRLVSSAFSVVFFRPEITNPTMNRPDASDTSLPSWEIMGNNWETMGNNFLSRSTYSVPVRLCDHIMSLASCCSLLTTLASLAN